MDDCEGCFLEKDTGCMLLSKIIHKNCWARCSTEAELVKRYDDMRAIDDRDRKNYTDELAYLLGRNAHD